MKEFFWKGLNIYGHSVKGSTSASSKEELQKILLQKGVALLSCKLSGKAFSPKKSLGKKVGINEKIFFFDQLSTLISSGISLNQALEIVLTQIKNKKFHRVVLEILNQISAGSSLSIAIKNYEALFSHSIISTIKMGEKTGKLDSALLQISNNLKEKQKITKNLKDAAFVPLITLIVALIVLLGIFIFIIPQFETFFTAYEKELPKSTKLVFGVSHFLNGHGILYLLLYSLFLVTFLKAFLRNKIIGNFVDKLLIKLKILGEIFLLYNITIFLKAFQSFLGSGIDMKKSLEFSLNTVKNTFLKSEIQDVYKRVVNGKSLAAALNSSKNNIFPKNLVAIVLVGEKTGELSNMVKKASNLLEQELSEKVRFYTSLLQPLLLITIGIFIALLLTSVYLPIFNMSQLFN